MCVCMYMCICVYMYVCIYIYIYYDIIHIITIITIMTLIVKRRGRSATKRGAASPLALEMRDETRPHIAMSI